MRKILSFLLILIITIYSSAQTNKTITGKVVDAVSKEPVQSAVISDSKNHSTITDAYGSFSFTTSDKKIIVSSISFETITVEIRENKNINISLKPTNSELDKVVVTANRTAEKRSEAPIAISIINKQTIEDTKAQRLDWLLNKVSGVNMINLGNEQHEMSIRQPMSTNNLFLYLEDGIPIRTSAVFNHNALLEMNMTAAKSIEVVKGPSSALYGAEAICGTVNLITQAPPAFTGGFASAQFNNNGYQRYDAQIGTTSGKVGFIFSGYYANQTNGPIQYSDFHKSASTYRLDYKIDNRTTWSNSISYIDYFSDMYGTLDSTHFAQKNYSAQILFTYRTVYAFRGKSVLTHSWNDHSSTSVSFMYRNNSVIQNPSYQIGSYHVGNISSRPISADTATGNINDNAFTSYGLFLQHVQKFKFLQSKLIIGTSTELNPQTFNEEFIWIKKQTINGLTNDVSYTHNNPDSIIANYRTFATDFASYADYEFSPAKGLRISAALRYDAFQYLFVNYLTGSNVTGGPSSITNYSKLAPKLGFTYNNKGIGFYGNYSEGYVPPQITQVFSKTNSTYLAPQTFVNYEIGGWLSLVQNKLYADWSAYLMNGTNEIISVKLPTGISQSENAGQTRHMGLEYGISYKPADDWYIHISASNAKHTFVNYVASGVSYNGYEMANAPHFFGNAELVYKPHAIKGLRIGIEVQEVGKNYMDNLNTHIYNSYAIANIRLGYQVKHAEIWLNTLNAFNTYYSTITTWAASSGYSYQLGDPRAFTIGFSYKFGK
jgi:outer membrane receptor protein involved in Fe transport